MNKIIVLQADMPGEMHRFGRCNKKVRGNRTFSYFLMRGEIVSSSTILINIIK